VGGSNRGDHNRGVLLYYTFFPSKLINWIWAKYNVAIQEIFTTVFKEEKLNISIKLSVTSLMTTTCGCEKPLDINLSG